MRRALAIGAALSLLLQVAEAIFPFTEYILPLGGGGFIQTSGCMLGSVCVQSFLELILPNGVSKDESDDDFTIL
jgi:hypothetical protein